VQGAFIIVALFIFACGILLFIFVAFVMFVSGCVMVAIGVPVNFIIGTVIAGLVVAVVVVVGIVFFVAFVVFCFDMCLICHSVIVIVTVVVAIGNVCWFILVFMDTGRKGAGQKKMVQFICRVYNSWSSGMCAGSSATEEPAGLYAMMFLLVLGVAAPVTFAKWKKSV